jgi:hypothetical protein
MSTPMLADTTKPMARVRVDVMAVFARVTARPLAALEKLRSRDRRLLSGAMLALLAGLELLVVLPMRDKRLAIDAALLNSASDQQLLLAQHEQALRERDDALQRRSDSVAAALAAVGATAAPRESLRFLLSRTLQGLPVQVTSLRALAGEEIVVEQGAPSDGFAAEPSASAPQAPPPLFRHRYELQVSGALPELLAALQALEVNARPLRVERVRLSADAQGAVQARITLLTLGSQRTWLAL